MYQVSTVKFSLLNRSIFSVFTKKTYDYNITNTMRLPKHFAELFLLSFSGTEYAFCYL